MPGALLALPALIFGLGFVRPECQLFQRRIIGFRASDNAYSLVLAFVLFPWSLVVVLVSTFIDNDLGGVGWIAIKMDPLV